MDDIRRHGAFSWSELTSENPAASLDFYTKIFGWTSQVFPMPGFDYTVVFAGAGSVGGIMPAFKPGMPKIWTTYVAVDDIDATVTLAQSLGAKVCVPITPIPGTGRIAILADPQDTLIGLVTYDKP